MTDRFGQFQAIRDALEGDVFVDHFRIHFVTENDDVTREFLRVCQYSKIPNIEIYFCELVWFIITAYMAAHTG